MRVSKIFSWGSTGKSLVVRIAVLYGLTRAARFSLWRTRYCLNCSERNCSSDTIRPWLSRRQRELTVYRGRKGVRISRDPASASWRDGIFLAGPVEEKVGNSGGYLFLEEVLSRAVGSLQRMWKRFKGAGDCAWPRSAHDRSVGIWLRSSCVLPHPVSPPTP